VVVSIRITITAVVVRLVIINRATVIIIASIVISVTHIETPRHPIGIYPSVAAPVIFPIAGNPIGAYIRS
jgi:hypothetical protein